MTSLPFTLQLPDKDTFSLSQFTSTKYRFQGRMRFAGEVLLIEWSGTAVVQEVGLLGLSEETVALPHESLSLPVDSIARMRLLGRWWRPRIEITTSDLESLRVVPSEDGGRVCFWIVRADVRLAAELVTRVNRP